MLGVTVLKGLRDFVSSLPPHEVEDQRRVYLEPEIEPAKRLVECERQGKALLFRLKGSEFVCAGNVILNRARLYETILGAKNDEEAYMKIIEAVSRSSKPKIAAFEDFYLRLPRAELGSLPFIKFYPGDGGRYLSASILISCLGEVCNASVHRVMRVSQDSVVARIVPRHLYQIYLSYKSRGEDAPVAIVAGAHPATLLMAASSPPFGVFELNLVPNILSDFAVAYTPLYSIPVPVPAALVIEGRILRNAVAEEGPFVDLLNLYDEVRKEPLIKVDAVYVNEEEYLQVILPGGREHKLLQSFFREALIWDTVRRVVPRVLKVRLLEAAGSWLHAAIAIEKLSNGDAKLAALAAFVAHPSLKMVTVVDGDVDVDSLEALEWARATRFRGKDSLIIVEKSRCSSLDPSSRGEVCDKVAFDLTIPVEEEKVKYKYVTL